MRLRLKTKLVLAISGMVAVVVVCFASIYISHKLDEVFAICDRITVLRDGSSVITLDAKQTSKAQVIKHMVGREITELFPRKSSTPGPRCSGSSP